MEPTIATLGLDKLTTEVRIRLMHELYESIPEKGDCFEISAEEDWELQQEVADCRLHPAEGKSWQETKLELNALRNHR